MDAEYIGSKAIRAAPGLASPDGELPSAPASMLPPSTVASPPPTLMLPEAASAGAPLSELTPELLPELPSVPDAAPVDELDPVPEPLPEEDEPEPLPDEPEPLPEEDEPEAPPEEDEEMLPVDPPSHAPAPSFEPEHAVNAPIAVARTAISQEFLSTIPTVFAFYERRPSTISIVSARPSASLAARLRSTSRTWHNCSHP